MKSTEMYKVLRTALSPWAKTAGFKRGSGSMLSYVQPSPRGASFLTFWFQCSQDGWDAYSGSKFTLELQDASEAGPGHGTRRFRFIKLMTAEEREQVRLLQNQVIMKLRPPPRDHWAYALDADTRKWYFAKFDLVSVPYRENEDVWMRYLDETDVHAWAQFLLPILPRLIEDFSARVALAGSGA
jgi:hypothetical protein